MASLKQIGAELGINYTLVSKVLSGRMGTTGVSAGTREAILRKAREINYRPNAMAVALKKGRRGAVGVFIHEVGVPGSEISLTLLKGIAAVLNSNDQRLWLRFFTSDEEFLASCDEHLQRDVDGLIVVGIHHPGITLRLREMERAGLALVSAYSGGTMSPLGGSVTIDNEMQGYLPTRHLLAKGCRRLAVFGSMELRHHGFVRAHEEAGVPVCPELFIASDNFFVAEGDAGVTALLASGQDFDGIVCQSDAQAMAAMHVLGRHGIRIPDQVRITGIDDSPIAGLCPVALTSVNTEMEACGRITAQLMLDTLAGRPMQPVTVAPRLVERASSR